MLIYDVDELPELGLLELLTELRVRHFGRLRGAKESERHEAEDRYRAGLNKGLRHVEAEHVHRRCGGRREVNNHGVRGNEQEEEQVMRLRTSQSLRSSV